LRQWLTTGGFPPEMSRSHWVPGMAFEQTSDGEWAAP